MKSEKTSVNMLIVSHSPHIGGAELALLDMMDYFYNQGMPKPHFIIPGKGGLADRLKDRKWPYTIIPYGVWAWSVLPQENEDVYREARQNYTAVKKIEKVISTVRPSLVLTNTVVSPWGALAAAIHRTPHVWYAHEYGDLDHGLTFEQGSKESLEDIGLLSDLIIANSKAIKAHLSEYVSKDKIKVAYIPFNPTVMLKKSQEKAVNIYSSNAAIKLIIVGRITPSKGQLDAVKAVGLLKKEGIKAELCIVGAIDDQDYFKKISKVIKQENIEKQIIIKKYLPNPFPTIKSSDVGLTCSKLEAFGRTTFEYLLLKKPVVGTNTGGTLELVWDKKNGFLYKHGSSEQLAYAIKQYVDRPGLIKRHATNSAAVVKEILEGKNSAGPLYEELQLLIQKKGNNQKIPNYTRSFMHFASVADEHKKAVEHELLNRMPMSQKELQIYLRARNSSAAKLIKIPAKAARKVKRVLKGKI